MSDMDWKSPFSGRKGGRDVGGSEKISDQPPVALEGWTCQECRAAGQLVVSLPHAATSRGLCRPLVQEESWMWSGWWDVRHTPESHHNLQEAAAASSFCLAKIPFWAHSDVEGVSGK